MAGTVWQTVLVYAMHANTNILFFCFFLFLLVFWRCIHFFFLIYCLHQSGCVISVSVSVLLLWNISVISLIFVKKINKNETLTEITHGIYSQYSVSLPAITVCICFWIVVWREVLCLTADVVM